ncbi:MAG: thioesterase family protein [Acidimicrobiales bacterium]
MGGSSSPEAFYVPLGANRYRATEHCEGPWQPGASHGGPPAGLIAGAFARFDNPFGLHIGRVSLELLGPIPLGEVRLHLERLRAGRRIELLEATYLHEDRPVIRARCWRIRHEERASPERGDFEPFPGPSTIPSASVTFGGRGHAAYADAIEWRFINGAFDRPGKGVVWARPRIPLIEGEEMSAIERVMVVLDSANGISSALPFDEWRFIPVDLTFSTYRELEGEWVGLAAETEIGSSGVGLTRSVVFDDAHTTGRGLQTLFVDAATPR